MEEDKRDLIEEIDISDPKSYDGESYKEALDLYFKSESFLKLSPEKQCSSIT